jgi:hypothetical protein
MAPEFAPAPAALELTRVSGLERAGRFVVAAWTAEGWDMVTRLQEFGLETEGLGRGLVVG